MHIDLNSCFATIEQQANPLLRGKPVAVAAYTTSRGCILAASVEAKKFGVKTGVRVEDGKSLCPRLVVLPPDPEKYRFVNHELKTLLSEYSADLSVESIDEMVVNFCDSPSLSIRIKNRMDYQSTDFNQLNHESRIKNHESIIHNSYFLIRQTAKVMQDIAREIKYRIRTEIGDWLMVSVGIAPNRYLAKVASSLHKPNGLDVITEENIEETLGSLALEDLCGIKQGIGSRLRSVGIDTPIKLYYSDAKLIANGVRSITGYHWWLRLHGWEDGSRYKAFGQEAPFAQGFGGPQQKSFGQSYAFGKPYTNRENGLYQVLWQMVAKMGRRLRQDGATASGIFTSCLFVDHSHWGQGKKIQAFLSTDFDFYARMKSLVGMAPEKPVRILAVGCFQLNYLGKQQSLLEEDNTKQSLTQAIDTIHDRWGDGVVTSGRVLGTAQHVLDRIAFGKAGSV